MNTGTNVSYYIKTFITHHYIRLYNVYTSRSIYIWYIHIQPWQKLLNHYEVLWKWSLFTENKHTMLLLSINCQHNSQCIMKIIYNRTILCLGASHFITRGGSGFLPRSTIFFFCPNESTIFFSFRMKVQFFFYYQSFHCFIIWPNENDIMVLRAPRQNPRLPMTSGVNTITKKTIGSIADHWHW